MAQCIQKRISKTGVTSYRVQIRQSDGFPPKSKSLPDLQEAKDWQVQEKARRRKGTYFKEQAKTNTLAELMIVTLISFCQPSQRMLTIPPSIGVEENETRKICSPSNIP